jgi:hypothetical protein
MSCGEDQIRSGSRARQSATITATGVGRGRLTQRTHGRRRAQARASARARPAVTAHTRVRSPALARSRKAMLEGGQRRVSTCSGTGGACTPASASASLRGASRGCAAVRPRPFLLGGALGICTPVPALVSRPAGPWRMHPGGERCASGGGARTFCEARGRGGTGRTGPARARWIARQACARRAEEGRAPGRPRATARTSARGKVGSSAAAAGSARARCPLLVRTACRSRAGSGACHKPLVFESAWCDFVTEKLGEVGVLAA